MKPVQETKFIQPSMGWCSVYSIANIVNDHTALKFTEINEFKGCDDKRENEVLRHVFDDNHQLINIAYSSQQHLSLPSSYVWGVLTCGFVEKERATLDSKIPITPFLLTVKLYDFIDVWHRIYVFVHDGNVYYSDPYKRHILKLDSSSDFDSLFHECQSIDRLGIILDGELKYLLLRGENLRYDWLINESLQCK